MFFKKNIIPITIFGVICLSFLVNSFFNSKECFQSSYYLVIDKVEDGGRGTELLYSKGKLINLVPYFPSYIRVGDSISKAYCAKMFIFTGKILLGTIVKLLN